MKVDPVIEIREDENASKALERFEAFLNDYFEDDSEHNFKVKYSKVTEENLQKVESEFSFAFPPSYREFVLEKGTISLGFAGLGLFLAYGTIVIYVLFNMI